jgi:hypothetical protein
VQTASLFPKQPDRAGGQPSRAASAVLLLAWLCAMADVAAAQSPQAAQEMQRREQRLGRIGRVASDVEILSRQQSFDEQSGTLLFEGNVQLRQGEVFELHAERVVYYQQTGWIQADETVRLVSGADVLTGSSAEYNIKTGRAKIHDTRAVLHPSLIVEARSIEKLAPHASTGQDRFYAEGGVFTSCHRPGTGWSLRSRSAMIHMDNYVHLYGVTFLMRGVPLFYLPYFVQSIKPRRASGFLPPQLGVDNVYGSYVALEYFWAILDALDLTLGVTPFAGGRVNASGEIRFRLAARDPINWLRVTLGQIFEDATATPVRRAQTIREIKARLNHEFPYRVKATASADLLSSRDEALSLGLDARTRRDSRADASVSRTWGSQSLQILASSTARVEEAAKLDSLLQRLPSVLYSSGAAWPLIGDAVKLRIETARLERFFRREEIAVSGQDPRGLDLGLWRAHFVPTLQGTFTLPGVSVEPTLSLIETYWSRRREVDPSFPTATFATLATEPVLNESEPLATIRHVGDGIYRHLYRAGLNVTGPSFYRIYGVVGPRESRTKHLIQPTARYQFVPYVDEIEVVDADRSIDRLVAVGSHSLTYGLSNVLLHKAPGQLTPVEVLRFDVTQTYRFLREREKLLSTPLAPLRELGDLVFSLQVRPGVQMAGTVRVALETDEWRPRDISANLRLDRRLWSLYGDYYRSAGLRPNPQATAEIIWTETRHSATLGGRVRLGTRWSLLGRGIYNLKDELVADSSLELGYRAQCWGLSVGGGLFQRKIGVALDAPSDTNFSLGFSVHLLNLGSVGFTQRLD